MLQKATRLAPLSCIDGAVWPARQPLVLGFSMGGGEVARYIGRYGTERVAKAVLAAAVPPYLYKSEDNPEGGLDDATIRQFEEGVREDRIAFLDEFTTNFFAVGDRHDLISESTRLYHREIAEFASPKGTLEYVSAFSYTDFREDLDKIDVPTLIIHDDSDAIVPFEFSGNRSHETLEDSTHAERFNRAMVDFLG